MNPAKLRQYFWFLFSIMGVVFFWVGLWDGIGTLGYLEIWWVSLLIGLLMFAVSGIVLRENNLFGTTNPLIKILHVIDRHPEKHLFQIKYHDKLKNRVQAISGHQISRLEKGFIVFLEGEYERFIPAHRITEILHKGKLHWKP